MQLNKKSRIFIAGHKGMVGSSILRYFKKKGYNNLFYQNRRSLDLLDQNKTLKYLKKIRPDFVIIAAAKVGGILANREQKAEFIYAFDYARNVKKGMWATKGFKSPYFYRKRYRN